MSRSFSAKRKPVAVPAAGKSSQPAPSSNGAGNVPASRPVVVSAPSIEAVRLRAYELYLDRSSRGESGDPADDWLKAERELMRR